jgi:phospholipid/cholesterol/gamma-HCH transport system substrate-binding protein
VKRLALIAALCALGVAFVLTGPAAPSGQAGDSVAVDALFHNAAGLVAGEDVKVAGVRAGTVKSVDLTDGRLALVEMEVDSPFAPFRADARCQVRSQSLIGERFIQCDPGTIDAGALPAGNGGTPTVPAEHDTAPIDLDLVFDVFRAPYRERLAIILNELGAGLTGRGEDLNAIIRSANPALAQARRVLADLNGQRADLTRGIDQTDRALGAVAADPHSVGRFVGKLAAVSERFGGHSDALGESVARLPALLDQAEPALRQLDGLSVDALPVLRNLRRSSPGVRELANQLGPLAHAARPTLRRLGQTAVTGKTAVDRSLPFTASLRRTLQGLQPLTPTTRDLVSSLVERGGTEGLLRFFYNAALATSRYDGTSHILPAHLVGGECGLYRTDEPPVQGCHGRFDYLQDTATLKGAGLKAKSGSPAAPGAATAPGAPTAPGSESVPTGGPGANPVLPSLPSRPSIPNLTPTAPAPSTGSGPVKDLLDFLLGQ